MSAAVKRALCLCALAALAAGCRKPKPSPEYL
jgi:hypothetical protein